MMRYFEFLLVLHLFSSQCFAQTLNDYYKVAAENNPGLQAIYKEYEAALQKVPQVKSLPDPTFSFGYFFSPVETRVGPQMAKFSLTQMFPWFGTLKAQGNVAALMAEEKFQNFIDARNKLFLQVATAYYLLHEVKDLIRIEQENIRLLESYKTIATQKFKNGAGTMVDVLRVDIMLKDAQTNLIILRDKEKPLLTSFNKLLNRSETELVQISDTLKMELLPNNFRKDSLIANNPKIKALDLKFQASQEAEIVAQKLGMPKFGIGLDYTLVGERTDVSMPDNGKNVLMPMISISIPIFRSKYNALVQEAQILKESYQLQKQELTNNLISEYEMTWFEIQQLLQQITLYQEQIHISQQSLNLLFAYYENSGKDFEEVLRMEQELLKYQKMKATALVQYHIAVAKINYLTSKLY